jgi:hypothetical protein
LAGAYEGCGDWMTILITASVSWASLTMCYSSICSLPMRPTFNHITIHRCRKDTIILTLCRTDIMQDGHTIFRSTTFFASLLLWTFVPPYHSDFWIFDNTHAARNHPLEPTWRLSAYLPTCFLGIFCTHEYFLLSGCFIYSYLGLIPSCHRLPAFTCCATECVPKLSASYFHFWTFW